MSYMHQANPHQQTHQNLPFSVSEIQFGYVQSPLNNPPLHPSFANLPPIYHNIVSMICATLVNEAQNNARNNPARTFFLNLLSSNHYNNNYYHDTVMTLVDVVMARALATNTDPHNLAQAVVMEMMKPLMGKLVIQDFPDLISYLSEDVYQDSMQQYEQYRYYHNDGMQNGPRGRQLFEQSMQSMTPSQPQMQQPFFNQQPVNRHMPPSNPHMGGPFGMQNSGGGYQPQPSQGGGYFPNQPNQGRYMEGTSNIVSNYFQTQQPHQPQHKSPHSLFQGGRIAEKDFSSPSRESARQPSEGQTKRSPVEAEITPDGQYRDYRQPQTQQRHTPPPQRSYERPVQVSVPPANNPPPAKKEEQNEYRTFVGENGVTYEETSKCPVPTDDRLYDSWAITKMVNGVEEKFVVVPEHISLWELSEPDWLGPIAYDPRTQFLVHMRSLTTTIVRQGSWDFAKDGSMDYLKNEINPVYRVRGGEPRHHVVDNTKWEDVQRLRHVEFDGTEENHKEIEDIKEHKTPFIVPENFVTETLNQAEFERDLFFLQHELDNDLHNSTHEFGYCETVKFIDLKEDLSKESILSELLAAATVGDNVSTGSFHHDFVALKDVIDDRVWHFLNNACTEQVNQIFKENMGLELSEWTIDDFAADFADIQQVMSDFYNDEQKGRDIFEMFEKHARSKVIMGGYHIVVGEELDTYIKNELGDLGDNHDLIRDRLIVLRRNNTVTQVDWETSEMPEIFDGTQKVVVIKERREKLYASLTAIQERARKRFAGMNGRSYIRTRDNVTFVIDHGAFNRRHLLLRMVDNV